MEEISVLANSDLTNVAMVLVAICGLIILYSQVIEAIRKLRKPKETASGTLAAHQTECDRKFANDQKRLNSLEDRTTALEEGSRVQLAALHALLEHELHNGNATEMKDASDAIFNHLNQK